MTTFRINFTGDDEDFPDDDFNSFDEDDLNEDDIDSPLEYPTPDVGDESDATLDTIAKELGVQWQPKDNRESKIRKIQEAIENNKEPAATTPSEQKAATVKPTQSASSQKDLFSDTDNTPSVPNIEVGVILEDESGVEGEVVDETKNFWKVNVTENDGNKDQHLVSKKTGKVVGKNRSFSLPDKPDEDDSFDFGANRPSLTASILNGPEQIEPIESSPLELTEDTDPDFVSDLVLPSDDYVPPARPVVNSQLQNEQEENDYTATATPSNAIPPQEPPEDPPETLVPDFGDDDDDLGPDELDPDAIDELVSQSRRTRRRQQSNDFANIRRGRTRDNRRRNRAASRSVKDRRASIRNDAAAQRRNIDEGAASDASDRIIRRLSAFGAARSIGMSGQMVAALAEMFVFQPEEQAAAASIESQRAAISEDMNRKLDALEQELADNAFNQMDDQEEIEDIINEANARFQASNNLDERDDIIEETRQRVEAISQRAEQNTQATSSTTNTGSNNVNPSNVTPPPVVNPPSPPSTSSSASSSSAGGIASSAGNVAAAVATRGASSSGSAASSAGRSTGTTGGKTPQGDFEKGLNSTTKSLLAVNVALEGMAIVSGAATEHIKRMGAFLVQDPTQGPGAANAAVGATLQSGGKAASLGGTLVGAGIGFAAGGPLGALAGGALGKGTADAVTGPIVEAIMVGNELMASFANQSLGAETLGANVEQEILTTLKQMEAGFEVDDITSAFVEEQGELNRAIVDMKTTLIKVFGDDLSQIVRIITGLLKMSESGVEKLDALITLIFPMKDILLSWAAQWINFATQEASDIEEIRRALEDAEGENLQFGEELRNFFNTNQQFQNQHGNNPFMSAMGFFNTPLGAANAFGAPRFNP